MATELGWPFLVSCNKSLDYRAVVAPQHLISAKATRQLSDLVGDAAEQTGIIETRSFFATSAGHSTIVFRSLEAYTDQAYEKPRERLRDNWGRPVFRFEGVLLFPEVAPQSISQEVLDFIHERFNEDFSQFWSSENWVTKISDLLIKIERSYLYESSTGLKNLESAQTGSIAEQIRATNAHVHTNGAITTQSHNAKTSGANYLTHKNLLDKSPDLLTKKITTHKVFASLGSPISDLAVSSNLGFMAARTKNHEVFSFPLRRQHSRECRFLAHNHPSELSCNIAFRYNAENEILTAFNLNRDTSIVLCHAQNCEQIQLCRTNNPISLISFSHSENLIYAANSQEILIFHQPYSFFSPLEYKLKRTLRHGCEALTYSKAEDLVAIADPKGLIRIYEHCLETRVSQTIQHQAAIKKLTFSGDGRVLVALDSNLELWSWDLRQLIGQRLHKGNLKFSGLQRLQRSDVIIAHDQDGILMAWKLRSGILGIWDLGVKFSHIALDVYKDTLAVVTLEGEILLAAIPPELMYNR